MLAHAHHSQAACAIAGLPDRAEALLHEQTARQGFTNLKLARAVIEACGKAEQLPRGEALYDELSRKRGQKAPDLGLVAALIRASVTPSQSVQSSHTITSPHRITLPHPTPLTHSHSIRSDPIRSDPSPTAPPPQLAHHPNCHTTPTATLLRGRCRGGRSRVLLSCRANGKA